MSESIIVFGERFALAREWDFLSGLAHEKADGLVAMLRS